MWFVSWLACAAPTFGVAADAAPGGALLAAWSDGDVLRMVGGDLGGGAGTLARVDEGGTWCTERADALLWWVHGPRPGEWYAVGEHGTIVHETDGVRVDESVDTQATLYGVYAAADAVWAVGGDPDAGTGEVWRRADGVWARFADAPGVVFKVWDGWFVGDGLAMRLEDGALVDHTPAGAPRLLTVRGRAADDVWAVGGDTAGVIVHWDGAAWTSVAPDPWCASRPLNGVFTGPDDDVWFAGMSGTVGRIDARGRFACPDAPITTGHLHAAWRHGDAVWFVGGDLFAPRDNTATLVTSPAPDASIAPEACD